MLAREKYQQTVINVLAEAADAVRQHARRVQAAMLKYQQLHPEESFDLDVLAKATESRCDGFKAIIPAKGEEEKAPAYAAWAADLAALAGDPLTETISSMRVPTHGDCLGVTDED